MMQKIRLETKSRELITEIELPSFPNGGEPDVIVWEQRVFVRRPQAQTEPPKKNDPETYFEAHAWHTAGYGFDKITEPTSTKATSSVRISEVTAPKSTK
jgi:hypothetical protein